jgi:RNA polymerase sigma-70 factor, ECF subfamily
MTDTGEFEVFMRNYQNMVYTTAYRFTANHAESQDIAQETFLKAYERFDGLRENPAAGGWLKTVATNLSLNHLSRYKKRWSFFSDMRRADDDGGEGTDFAANIAAPETREAETSAQEDTRALLDDALAKLPHDQRSALVLYHFHDMPYQEIAAKLKVSLAKVKTDIMRGRDALKRKLGSRMSELEISA